MSTNYKAAVEMAVAILSIYRQKFPGEPFPTIHKKLLPLVEGRAGKNGVDNIYVKRFKERMFPLVGQVRRIRERNGMYQAEEDHAVIYLCPSLELEWQRFVQIKEASHVMLDKPEDYVHSDTDIDELLVRFAQFGAPAATKQFASEMRAIVCAIELLFPREVRQQLQERYDAGIIAPAEIAKEARFPALYVRTAMGSEYRGMIEPIYAEIEQEAAEKAPALTVPTAKKAVND